MDFKEEVSVLSADQLKKIYKDISNEIEEFVGLKRDISVDLNLSKQPSINLLGQIAELDRRIDESKDMLDDIIDLLNSKSAISQ